MEAFGRWYSCFFECDEISWLAGEAKFRVLANAAGFRFLADASTIASTGVPTRFHFFLLHDSVNAVHRDS